MSIESGRTVHSVVVAIDGEAECGKTTTIRNIATEASFQASIIPGILAGDPAIISTPLSPLSEHTVNSLQTLQTHLTFNRVVQISAGNMFRAAALYKMRLEAEGSAKSQFEPADTLLLRQLLAQPGIKDVLQSDPDVKSRVSTVAKTVGVQALCGALFCDALAEAYYADGGGNLVIADARDPIGHMRRNNILGKLEGQIDPTSILPIYIDTHPEVAAARGGGDYNTNLDRIRGRRLTDATRTELPVTRPADLIDGYGEWLRQLFSNAEAGDAIVSPFRLVNNEEVGLDGIQNFGGHIAVVAQELGHYIFHRDA